MKYIEALYGSQYQELIANDKSGASGRLNGNLFLSAFIILVILLVIAIPATLSSGFSEGMNSIFHKLFGYSSGKTIGKMLAIPLMFVIYFIISRTVGNEANYEKTVAVFMTYPEEERKKANWKILKPFFIVLGVFFLLLMSTLY